MIKKISLIYKGLLLATLLIPLPSAANNADQNWIYVTKPGDNLWDITTRYLTGIKYWRPTQRLNNITRPRQIPPGTHIHIPVKWSKVRLANVRIKAIHGAVRIKKTGPEIYNEALVGESLSQNDTIITPANTSILLEFADGSDLLLVSNSKLTLETLKAYGDGDVTDSRIRLHQGQAENHTNPDKIPGTRFNITTPSALMAIRGTNFRVDSSDAGTRIEVTSGRVSVINNAEDEILLHDGFGLLAQAGQALKAPLPLLSAPDLTAVPAVIESNFVKIDIPAIDGAIVYRVQITEGKNLGVLLHDSEYQPKHVVPDLSELPDGRYIMRVRGIDASGIEGHDRIVSFTLNAHPVPPASIAPVAGTSIVESMPEFRWARPEGSSSYRLQVFSGQSRLAALIDKKQIDGEHFTASSQLPPGEYRWRVQANDRHGQPGPFGHFQSFRILPEPPAMGDPLLDDKNLTLQWHAADTNQKYHFQLSRQRDFSALLVDQELDTSHYVISDPEQGYYYMRVSTIDSEGYQGPYSPVQAFQVPGPDRGWLPIVMFLAAILFAL